MWYPATVFSFRGGPWSAYLQTTRPHHPICIPGCGQCSYYRWNYHLVKSTAIIF